MLELEDAAMRARQQTSVVSEEDRTGTFANSAPSALPTGIAFVDRLEAATEDFCHDVHEVFCLIAIVQNTLRAPRACLVD